MFDGLKGTGLARTGIDCAVDEGIDDVDRDIADALPDFAARSLSVTFVLVGSGVLFDSDSTANGFIEPKSERTRARSFTAH
jgi:exo-beta-1,3-glucanase (GH17 family)